MITGLEKAVMITGYEYLFPYILTAWHRKNLITTSVLRVWRRCRLLLPATTPVYMLALYRTG